MLECNKIRRLPQRIDRNIPTCLPTPHAQNEYMKQNIVNKQAVLTSDAQPPSTNNITKCTEDENPN